MTQLHFGFEVTEKRLKNQGIELRIENTLECLEKLRPHFAGGVVEIDEEHNFVVHWYGDADGEPNCWITGEDGTERITYAEEMTAEKQREFYEQRRREVEEKGVKTSE